MIWSGGQGRHSALTSNSETLCWFLPKEPEMYRYKPQKNGSGLAKRNTKPSWPTFIEITIWELWNLLHMQTSKNCLKEFTIQKGETEIFRNTHVHILWASQAATSNRNAKLPAPQWEARVLLTNSKSSTAKTKKVTDSLSILPHCLPSYSHGWNTR